jgi:Alginate export
LKNFLLLFVLFASNLNAQTAATPPPATPAQVKRVSDYANSDLPGWFRFSGEYRMRLEGIGGASFRPDANDAFVLGRLRLNTTFIPTSWMKIQLQAQDAQVGAKNAPKPDGPPFEDSFDLRQAYVDFGNVEGGKFALRAGRQELAFGEQRLIGHVSWLNTARSFDAVRASYRTKDYRVDAFVSSVVNPREGEFDKRTDANNFHGIYASFNNLVPKGTIEPYLLWRVARGVRSEAGTIGKLDFKTTGFRVIGKLPANFDYGAEIAEQAGAFGSDYLRAWGGHWVLGYSLSGVKFTPRLVAEYNYASGDHSPTDGRRGTFDQLYPTPHDKYGLADQVGWRNLHDTRAGFETKLSPKLALTGFYHSWWLADTHDGLYNVAGALVVRVPRGTAGKHIGQEADFQAVYALNNLVQIGGGYGHIFPGTFLKNTTPGKAFDFSYLMVTYLF